MARLPLSRLAGWRLGDPAQDLRGLGVLDQDGNALGTIQEMLVNTLTGVVDGVVLDNGESVYLRDLRHVDGALRMARRRR